MLKKILSISFLFILILFGLVACGEEVQMIEVSLETEENIKVGESVDLKLTILSENGEIVNIKWNNSNPKVLSFDKDTMKLTGLEKGKSTISVEGDNLKKTSVTIEVEETKKVYTITYILDGGLNNEENPAEYEEGSSIRLKEPTREWYMFLGWYDENDNLVEKIDRDMTGNITLTAKWEEEEQKKDVYTITYELNGGNWLYDNYYEVAQDLLDDYNDFLGVPNPYTTKNIPFGSWNAIDFHHFFYSAVNGVSMKAKWGWLADYFGEVGGANNKKACSLLTSYNSAKAFDNINSNYKYAVSYEFRAFIKGVKFTENTSYSSADYSLNELRNGFWDKLNEKQNKVAQQNRGETIELSIPVKQYFEFDGWYKEADFSGEKFDSTICVRRDTTLYAKWIEKSPVESVKVSNKTNELLYNKGYQLSWEVLPNDASNPNVEFTSSDEAVATISSKGYIVGVGEGTTTITVISQANNEIIDSFELRVYKPNRISVSYEDKSYVVVGETIKINAEYIGKNHEKEDLTFTSSNTSVASVGPDGLVTGHASGNVTITIKGGDQTIEVGVTVVNKETSELLGLILSSHNSNIYVTEDMLIALAYRTDIYGSASDILFNYDYKEIEMITPLASEGGKGNRPGTKMSSVEFITVHYTAGASPSSDAEATARYFYNGGAESSIHYCTGNDGVYHCMPDDEVAWHAGDGTKTKFEWIPTGVKQNSGDPVKPEVGVSDDGYFTVNGQKTKVEAPGGLDRVLGEYVKPDEKYFTLLGPAIDVFNGEYHIGTTWWCNSQVAEGRISSHGGNNNSIGIESACNQGSDLWYTWQITAQLVAKLMEENNLAINRVVGHNFFSGKDCPQPMLEYEGEIWYQFIECVESEYEIRTKYENAKISAVSNAKDLLLDNGRVKERPEYTTSVSYTVTIELNGQKEVITLSSIIPGVYE